MFIPITKVDEEKREVYGIMTAEKVDKSGECLDYDQSKGEIQKWSDSIKELSKGKSLGNVRRQHSAEAVGKVVDIVFNNEAKQVECCSKITDDKTWNDILEGVINGYSIGGSYQKRWYDEELQATKYIPSIAELSVVDNPCLGVAGFEVIKANGTTEQREFKHMEVKTLEVNKDILGEFQKALATNDLAKAFSYEEIRDRVNAAITDKVKTPTNYGYFWIENTYSDSVIVKGDLDGDGDKDLCRIPYTIDADGAVTIGEAQQVKVEYVPIKDETGGNGADVLTTKSQKNLDLEKGDKEEKDKKDPADKGKDDKPQDDKKPDDKKAKDKKLDDGEKQDDEAEKDNKKDKTDKTAESDGLEKAGAKHSKDTLAALQKMAHDLNTMGGACKCDKCAGMYKKDMANAAQTSGMEKAIEMNQQLAKAMEGMSVLQKEFDGLKADNEALSKKVTDLENMPMPGGPVLGGGAVINKSLAGNMAKENAPSNELDLLKRLRDEEKDPMLKQMLSQKVAIATYNAQ